MTLAQGRSAATAQAQFVWARFLIRPREPSPIVPTRSQRTILLVANCHAPRIAIENTLGGVQYGSIEASKMRAFNQLVFDQYVRGTAEVVSPTEFNDLLWRADSLAYEIEVEESGGTSPTLTVRHLHSNSGKAFVGTANLITAAVITNPPFRDIKAPIGPFGALGQVGVTLGGTGPTARVRIWACGRTD